jgi:Domain of unknown function (DUF4185)
MQARLFLRCLALLLWSGCETSQPTAPTAAVTPGKNSEPAARDAGPPSASLGSTTGVDKPRGNVFDGAAPADSGQFGATSDACVESVCEAGPEAPPATWSHSAWSGRVGVVGEDDTTLWCTTAVLAAGYEGAAAAVDGQLDRVALDGARQAGVGTPQVAQRVSLRCFADAARSGPSTLVTSAWSVDDQQDRVRAQCPDSHPFGALAQCQIAAEGKPPLVYAGPSCGDGVSAVVDKPTVHGQLIGDHYELSTPGKPLFNNTGKAAVMGSDLGFQFLAQGRMYVGFGDTWENEASLPGANGFRGSVLAYTKDFDPKDDNGIELEGWETSPERPEIATEVIRSPHDQTGATEFTAIAAAGFGLTEGSDHYRFLWFAAIKQWDPLTTNESTLAWSKNGAPFTRGDRAPDAHPARWPFKTFFGPGAAWVDREQGYVYFFGVRTYQPAAPVRLSRVRATVAAVLDHLQYEYWTGSAWQRPDPEDEYALAMLDDSAADLVPGNAQQNNRPEISVAYNPYLGRFIMMLHNDATPFKDEAQTYLELWESETPQGPWKRADGGDQLTLPAHLYGPYMSEQTQSEGGRAVYFALSAWNLQPLSRGQPYVVGLWSLNLERKLRPGCTP